MRRMGAQSASEVMRETLSVYLDLKVFKLILIIKLIAGCWNQNN